MSGLSPEWHKRLVKEMRRKATDVPAVPQAHTSSPHWYARCNGCGLCFSVALQNFMYSNDSSYYYVYQQPADEREEADIREAISVCPMDCIKDDGEPIAAA